MATSPLTHLGWAAVAAGTFFAGGKLLSPPTAEKSGATDINPQGGTLGSKSASAAVSNAGATNLPPLSSLAEVEIFLKKYTSQSGPLSQDQMKAAMEEVLTESDPIKSSLMFSLLMEKLSPENAPTVLQEVRAKVPGFEGFRYIGLLAYKWGSMDGPTAMAETMKQTGPGRFIGMAGLSGWAGKDPAAAAKWLEEQKVENPWEKSMMTRGLINGLARSDTNSAVDYVMKMEDKEERSRMTQAIAEEKIKQGVTEAGAWALGLKDPDMKKGAFESVAEQLYRGDPQAAAKYIKENAAQDYASNAAGELARRLAQQNPQEALTLAKDLPVGTSRTKAYTNTYREWAQKEPEAASGALAGMGSGPDKDAAAAGLAPAVVKEDPHAATVWAESISDATLQQETLTQVLREQYRSDPDAAIGYMTTKGWTAEQQNAVKIQTENRGPRFGPPR
jgi:hypothetical protein